MASSNCTILKASVRCLSRDLSIRSLPLTGRKPPYTTFSKINDNNCVYDDIRGFRRLMTVENPNTRNQNITLAHARLITYGSPRVAA